MEIKYLWIVVMVIAVLQTIIAFTIVVFHVMIPPQAIQAPITHETTNIEEYYANYDPCALETVTCDVKKK